MKNSMLLPLPLMALAACASSTPDAAEPVAGIVTTLQEKGNYQTFVELLQLAGVDDELAGAGPFTVFAPNDEAFAEVDPEIMKRGRQKQNRDKLRALLRFHVSRQRLTATGLREVTQVSTMSGQPISVKAKGELLIVGNAVVVSPNVMAPNGIVHEIDHVVRPPRAFFEQQAAESRSQIKGGPDSWWW
jgi:uncharacterized surface protein with fasciclin (FAS1) repeats